MANNVLKTIWQPEFSRYTDCSDAELYKGLEEESNNNKAPESYRKVISRVTNDIKRLSEQSELDRSTIERLERRTKEYSEYVKSAEKNYDYLAELYKSEHKSNLDQKEKILELELKLKQMEETQAIRDERLKRQVADMKSSHNERIERQREEFTKSANRQAQGRKNIEEKLVTKDNELADMRNRLQNLEARLAHLENQNIEKNKESEHYQKENSQLKLLLNFFQQPQQQPQQQQQQQQQQQPQQPQQHIQHF
ncbi:hypothetical protein BD770DRAFT_426981 [Pilaira anomala]|nr:hypothetical protein BD770DRAFT_426981 [Pilaira anomala]